MLGKIFKNILIFLLGMIFGVVALVGGGYLAVTKLKIGQITDKVLPEDQQYVGEELKKLSILQGIELLSKLGDTKISEYNKLVPILSTTIEKAINDNLGDYVIVDYDKLYDCTISNISSSLTDSMSIIASLDSLKNTLGFTLPSLPLFDSVEKYIKITDDSFNVKNKFYLKDENKSNIFYAEENDGLTTYTAAYNNDGTLIDSADSKELFFKASGISSIPVTDAVSSLSEILNFDTLSLGDMQTNFGIKLLEDEEGIPTVLAKIFTPADTLNSLSSNITERIENLKISDLGINIENEILSKLLGTGEDELTIGSLTSGDTLNNKINGLTIEDLGMQVDGVLKTLMTKEDGTLLTIGELTTSETLDEQINKMKLSEFGITFEADSIITKVLGTNDPTVSELKDANFEQNIDNLTISELNISLSGIADKILSPDTSISDLKSDNYISNKIDSLTMGDLELNLNGIASKILSADTKVSDLKADDYISSRVESLTMEDLGLDLDGIAGKILSSDTKVSDLKTDGFLSGKIDGLSVSDLGLNITENGIMSKIIPADCTVEGLKTIDFETKINSLTMEDLGLDFDGNAMMSKIISKDDTVGNLSTIDFTSRINELDLIDVFNDQTGIMGELIYKHDSDGNVIEPYENTKISEINGEIKYAKLSAILGETSDNSILNALLQKNATIDNLSDKLSELKMSDVFQINVFEKVTNPSIGNKMVFTYDEENKTYTEVSSISSGVEYYQITSTASVWLFMMYEKTSGTSTTISYKEKDDITLLGMDSGVSDISTAFSNATMKELYNIGVLQSKPGSSIENCTLTEIISMIPQI